MDETIKIDSNDGFLHMEDLPHDCIFNKVVTGCGATTIALMNDEDYIIAVPTTELIVNKTGRKNAGTAIIKFGDKEQCVFGLFGIFKDAEKALKEYLLTDGTKKIICTYDKISKLTDLINPSDYRLLIDEYHCLLKAYSYRQVAIDGVLEKFKQYKSFCFMSATPINATFRPDCLKGTRQVTALWDRTDKMKVDLIPTNKPYVYAANIIKAYQNDGYIEIDGVKSHEAYFFINSVTDIAAIIHYCNLSNDEVRIICANTDANKKKLSGYAISNSRSPNRIFNFITSKSFEGADYFSDDGICFVVSSASNPHTQASIDTDIPQIAGRIRTRNNPFRYKLVHIFNRSYKNLNLDVSYDEMVRRTEMELQKTRATVDLFNKADDLVKGNLRDKLKNNMNELYMSYDKNNDMFTLNDILPKLELYNYQVNQKIYKDGISLAAAYRENDIDTQTEEFQRMGEILHTLGKKLSFKDAFLEYADAAQNKNLFKMNRLAQEQPLIVDAYKKLGVDRVRSMRYTKKAIQDALNNLRNDMATEQKIARQI